MNTKRGCLDCKSYETPVKQQPCKDCEKFSRWEDKNEPTGSAKAGT